MLSVTTIITGLMGFLKLLYRWRKTMSHITTIITGFLGFLTGVLVGAIVALFFAPMTGAELRARARAEALATWNKAMAEMRLEMEKMHSQMAEYQPRAVDEAVAQPEQIQPQTGEAAG
jgi:gas vesicle protein